MRKMPTAISRGATRGRRLTLAGAQRPRRSATPATKTAAAPARRTGPNRPIRTSPGGAMVAVGTSNVSNQTRTRPVLIACPVSIRTLTMPTPALAGRMCRAHSARALRRQPTPRILVVLNVPPAISHPLVTISPAYPGLRYVLVHRARSLFRVAHRPMYDAKSARTECFQKLATINSAQRGRPCRVCPAMAT